MAQSPSSSPPQPPEEPTVLVRGSEEYREYMRHQGGRIKAIVNGIEDFLSASGRTLLLVFVLYTTIKGGMAVTGHDVPWLIDIVMLGFQVCGLEGSIPGLSRLRESLLIKNTPAATNDATKIRATIQSARTLNFLTGVEILLAAYAHNHNMAILKTGITIADISELYGYVLLLARLWFITSFIIEMSRMEVKRPKIISQAEYKKQQQAKEQEQIRMDNAAIQAHIDQALDAWTKTQDQHLATQIAQLTQQLHSQLAQLFGNQLTTLTSEQERMMVALQQVQDASSAIPAVNHQAIIADVLAYFETRFVVAMKRLEGEVKQQVLVSLASETKQVKQGSETALPGPRLVPLPQRPGAPRTVQQSMGDSSTEAGSASGSGEAVDYRALIYPLMDEDNRRQVADLMQLTGLPKTVRTTVWRWWNRYHEEHGTRGMAQIVAGNIESQSDGETA